MMTDFFKVCGPNIDRTVGMIYYKSFHIEIESECQKQLQRN